MRSTHNTIRALVIGIGLTLLVITGTAAVMAAFSAPAPATHIYRRVAVTAPLPPTTHQAIGHDTVLYEPVVLVNGRVQWVLSGEPDSSSIYSSAARTVSYTLVVKPTGLSKAVKNCSPPTNHAYDIACNLVS
ncbi:hypothetical protein GCM10011496_04440 [Polaromonas eurypsychrophila]|uniref:Uncharacterized protein n=1 Tax=Polaromonas eurypsychrophila TaxID=1614635 RepID=A0A916WD06_9BURK|nr:hypothetical protein GCM10011496_04440 [Polaromonas eurypsychrophila]